MPSRDDLGALRLGLGGPMPAYYPRGGGGGSRLIDLIMFRGQQQAQAAQQQGEIWGNAFQNIGKTIAGGFEEYGKQQEKEREVAEMAKRDAAWVAYVQSGEWMKDPKAGLAMSIKTFGPQEGVKQFQGLAGASQLLTPKRDEKADGQAFVAMYDAAAKWGEPARATMWPDMMAVAKRKYPDVPLPDQYTPEGWELAGRLVDPLRPPRKLGTARPGDVVFDEGTGTEVLKVPPEPPKPPNLQTVETAAGIQTFNPQTGAMGPVVAQPRPRAVSGQGGGASNDDVSLLLQGGTADKIPIKVRSAAVADARASGGVQGTGFVPMNVPQQQKFSDFMDLRRKAARLEELLADEEVTSSLGPMSGWLVGKTKELSLVGASTKVKEAFDLFKDLSDTELRKRSGAAISPNEYERIVGFTVDPTKQADSNRTNLTRMLESIEAALGNIGAAKLPPRGRQSTNARPRATNPQTGEIVEWDGRAWVAVR